MLKFQESPDIKRKRMSQVPKTDEAVVRLAQISGKLAAVHKEMQKDNAQWDAYLEELERITNFCAVRATVKESFLTDVTAERESEMEDNEPQTSFARDEPAVLSICRHCSESVSTFCLVLKIKIDI